MSEPLHSLRTASKRQIERTMANALIKPADAPALVVMAENAAAALTALHLQLAVKAPSASSAYFAGRFQRTVLANTWALAFRAMILRYSMDA